MLNALQAEGTVQDASESAGTLRVRGVVGAGILNMNPAVVTVDIRRVAEDRSYMIVRGTPKRASASSMLAATRLSVCFVDRGGLHDGLAAEQEKRSETPCDG